jgi:hypothetical protein
MLMTVQSTQCNSPEDLSFQQPLFYTSHYANILTMLKVTVSLQLKYIISAYHLLQLVLANFAISN